MAIDIQRVNSEITLEIDEGDISIADFQKASDSFLGLVKEMTKQTGESKASEAWRIEVYPGSVGLGLSANSWYSGGETVRHLITEGLENLAKGLTPVAFSDKALECSKALASSFKNNIGSKLRVWNGKTKSVVVNKDTAKTATNLLSPAYDEDSAMDGRIEILNSHGKPKFVIYDVAFGTSINCFVPQDLMETALMNFGKRVEVIGLVSFRKNGRASSIKAQKIIPFPDKSTIPTLDEMRWLLKGAPA